MTSTIAIGSHEWQPATLTALGAAGLDPVVVESVISAALAEDLADGPDATTEATVSADQLADAAITPRSSGILAGTPVALAPALTGVLAVGDVASGILTGLSVPVTAGSRLLIVFSAAVTGGIDIATILTGFASAGVTIE